MGDVYSFSSPPEICKTDYKQRQKNSKLTSNDELSDQMSIATPSSPFKLKDDKLLPSSLRIGQIKNSAPISDNNISRSILLRNKGIESTTFTSPVDKLSRLGQPSVKGVVK